MVETCRSAAAAASPECDGSDGGGKDGRCRGKRQLTSPLASSSPSKRGKLKEKAPAMAAGESSGPEVTGKPLIQKRQQPRGGWARMPEHYSQQGRPCELEIEERSKWEEFKDEMKQSIVSPEEIEITFVNSPYFVSGTTNEMFLSSAVIHMEREFRKRMRQSSLYRHIVLSGPPGSQTYQEALIKALAKHFDAKLLIVDSRLLSGLSVNELRKEKDDAPSTSSGAGIVGMSNEHIFREDAELRSGSSVSEEVDTTALGNLIEVISEEGKSSKLIVLLKDVKSLFIEHREWLSNELPSCVLIIGSQTQAQRDKDEQKASGSKLEKCRTVSESRNSSDDLFPNKISLEVPQNEAQLSYLVKQLEHDCEMIKAKAHVINIDEGTSSERIRNTLEVLPPPPDSKMVGYMNQYIDLWASGQALGPWADTWMRLPLVFHDADVVEAVEIRLPDYVKRDHCDETDTISKVLKNHPGPIKCLRVDRTACPGPGVLREWVDMLSEKGVQDLVLLNVTRPMEDLEFPLHRLQSCSLQSLALGFFGLATLSLDLYDNLASVRNLNLSGCRFSGQALSAVISSLLPELSSLTLGCSDVTAGCDERGLVIDSRRLKTLHFWECSAASGLTIAYAPALEALTTGLFPNPAALPSKIFIDLRSAPALQMLIYLELHLHQLQIWSDHYVWFNGRRVVSLPCLKTLVVGIKLCMPPQASVLVGLLGRLPQLQNLTLWRLDELSPGAGADVHETKAWSLNYIPLCIKNSLKYLVMRDYRGGSGEVTLVRCLLSAVTRLLSVTLQLHATVPREHAAAPFLTWPRACSECAILVEVHEE